MGCFGVGRTVGRWRSISPLLDCGHVKHRVRRYNCRGCKPDRGCGADHERPSRQDGGSSIDRRRETREAPLLPARLTRCRSCDPCADGGRGQRAARRSRLDADGAGQESDAECWPQRSLPLRQQQRQRQEGQEMLPGPQETKARGLLPSSTTQTTGQPIRIESSTSSPNGVDM
jgi:hypothetical protein